MNAPSCKVPKDDAATPNMNNAEIERRILQLAAGPCPQITVAAAVLHLGLTAEEAAAALDRMVTSRLLELDSFDDGTLYYHSPQLAHMRGAGATPTALARATGFVEKLRRHVPSGARGQALALFSALSILDFFGTGLGALLAHSREARILLWIALAGTPGTLLALIWLLRMLLKG